MAAVGLGKTHLDAGHYWGHHINKVRGNPVEIAYVSGENFLYQVVRCIREDKMTARLDESIATLISG